MNNQGVRDKTNSENLNRLVLNEIINNLWATGGAISHDENNDLLKVVVNKELEENGEKKAVQDLLIYPIQPKSKLTLLFMAGNTLNTEKENRPSDLHQAYLALKEANAKHLNSLTPEMQQELYQKDFIKVPGHDWITKTDAFAKESKVTMAQEFAQA